MCSNFAAEVEAEVEIPQVGCFEGSILGVGSLEFARPREEERLHHEECDTVLERIIWRKQLQSTSAKEWRWKLVHLFATHVVAPPAHSCACSTVRRRPTCGKTRKVWEHTMWQGRRWRTG